ncbi:cystathionine beta-lyase [Microvirga tunisiensis]|uniref:Cystathionine beta-lyase n=2 Tax=Pannonibacter tanglangensis TaxID=2750084 RepID=A0ABW9ZDB6_9HYPH|nr:MULTISPECIES: cystathionine beta-lyase [unclassified Pannonibacter]NBN62424.1 cystathionine beta-lyase [Pannonibacter sp. XCT-34]NBN78080.1 cystathionine beta-lyase [Pannonibacter sp. XCT-53]
MSKKTPPTAQKPDTILVHAGRHPEDFHGFVNPPVVHASTVLFPDTAHMAPGAQKYNYARRGNPTTDALEEALMALEGAAGVKLATSGLNAVSLACLSCLKTGDHFLVADTVYGPTRHFCDTVLPRYGITVEYYRPDLGGAIRSLFRPNTAAVFTEAPGSLTFEMQDIPAIAAAAKETGAFVLMDNTWATPLYFKPIAHGVDLSIQAGTKYIVGHSDVTIGTIAASARALPGLLELHGAMGVHIAPDDVYLALRGLRTMGIRLERHQQTTLAIADWLAQHPKIARIRYPAWKDDPGHAIWARDFSGASGLFGFDFTPNVSKAEASAFLDALRLFGLGYSWGGFESLAIPVKLAGVRSAGTPLPEGESVRLNIGLEDPADLIEDLSRGFAAIGN